MRRLQVLVPLAGVMSMDITVDDDADASAIEAAAVYAANEYLGDIYGPHACFSGEAMPHMLADDGKPLMETTDLVVLFDEATDGEPAWAL